MAVGIDGKSWAKTYLRLRAEAEMQNPGSEAIPMLPAPKKGYPSSWCTRYLTSSELNSFMKAFFKQSGLATEGKKLSSHSLKATGLSWSSKFGVSGEMRAILARHVSAVQGPTALYSRGVVSPAMRVFQDVVEKIRLNWFHPDKTRGGMITPQPTTPAAAGRGAPMPATPGALDPYRPAQMAMNPLGHIPSLSMEEKAAEEASPVPTSPAESDWLKVKAEPAWCLPAFEGVIDVDAAFAGSDLEWLGHEDALSACHRNENSDMEEDDESESESSDDDTVPADSPVESLQLPQDSDVSKWFINCKSLVLHCLKDAERCNPLQVWEIEHAVLCACQGVERPALQQVFPRSRLNCAVKSKLLCAACVGICECQ